MEDKNLNEEIYMRTNKNGSLIIWGIIGIIIMGLYFIFINNPRNEQKKVEVEQSYINQRIQNTRDNLEICLNNVDIRVRDDMLKWCNTFAQAKTSAPNVKFIDLMPGCSLPEESSHELIQGWQKDKADGREECYKKYPQ